jgi:hypothetical protein
LALLFSLEVWSADKIAVAAARLSAGIAISGRALAAAQTAAVASTKPKPKACGQVTAQKTAHFVEVVQGRVVEPDFWADAAGNAGQLPGRLPVWLMCTKVLVAVLVDNVVATSQNSGCTNMEQQETPHHAAYVAKPSAAPSPVASNGVGEIAVRAVDAEVAIQATARFLASCTKSESVVACFNQLVAIRIATLTVTRVAIAHPAQ